MITPEEHLARILGAIAPLPARRVPLRAAAGRVAAEDVRSRFDTPLFDNSAMDGYAVRAADATAGVTLTVVDDVPAGSAADPRLLPGQAARIMTGAAVPTDADAIVPLEATTLGLRQGATPPPHITLLSHAPEGQHIRRRSEDVREGDVVLTAGTVLEAWQLSTVASAGWSDVLVHDAPRVAIVSTGSELVRPDASPARGQIPESNSTLLAVAAASAGATVTTVLTVPDDPSALEAALATLDADIVVLSGGASVGAFDVARHVLSTRGVHFESVAMQPGKPQGFGVRDGVPTFCLPGNPVSVAVSFEVFVRPALRRLAGLVAPGRTPTSRVAASAWRSPAGRVQFVPVIADERTVHLASAGGSRSHLVSSLGAANALAIIPAATEHVRIGDDVDVMVVA